MPSFVLIINFPNPAKVMNVYIKSGRASMSCDTVNNINKSTTVHAHVDLLLLFSDFPSSVYTANICLG